MRALIHLVHGWGRWLFAQEGKGDRLPLRPYDANNHGAIRGQAIAFDGNRAGLRRRNFQNVVIPAGLALEVFRCVKCGVVLAIGDVVVVERLRGAFIHETAGDDNDALPIGDGHGAGLNHRLAGEVALGGHQRPGAIQGAMVTRKRAKCTQRREGGSGDSSS